MTTKSYNASGSVSALGICEVDLAPKNMLKWTVQHIAVNCNGAASSVCNVYVDSYLFCGTATGNGDTADGSPLIVNALQTLKAVWTLASPNAICTLTIIVDEETVGWS